LDKRPKQKKMDIRFGTWNVRSRGGSRIGTVELQHPLLPLDIVDNI
jgi:hypothetical protein